MGLSPGLNAAHDLRSPSGRRIKAPILKDLLAEVGPYLSEVPEQELFDNAFKAQWELFLKHIVKDTPFPWDLKEGAKGVQLAEKGIESWEKRCWVDIEEL